MDQREWGLLRETVVRRTQASGASREDAEDATHDALLAAIGQPEHAQSQHPHSEVAWLSTVAKRRRVDLIRQRVREQRAPTTTEACDPTAAGPEDVVVDRAHASWLTASLTQLPSTTREVVDAVGSGMAPAEVANSMNLSARSVESHLTRARRHLRRMGALGLPIGVLIGWALRARPGTRVALVAAVPAVAATVMLLPTSHPLQSHPEAAAPAPPATVLPGPGVVHPAPRNGPVPDLPAPAPAPGLPGTGPGTGADSAQLGTGHPGADAGTVLPDAAAPERPGVEGTATRPDPEGRALAPQCPLELPLLGNLGCVVVNLVDGVVHSVGGGLGSGPAGSSSAGSSSADSAGVDQGQPTLPESVPVSVPAG